MGVHVSWDDEAQTVVCITFEDPWIWEEVHAAQQETAAMITTVEYTVDVIIDFRQISTLPPGAIWNYKKVASLRPPNAGLTVFVGANRLVRAVYEAVRAVYSRLARDYLLADTLEEAYSLFAERRAEEE